MSHKKNILENIPEAWIAEHLCTLLPMHIKIREWNSIHYNMSVKHN